MPREQGANYQVKDGIPSGGRLWSDELAGLLGPARDPAAPLEDRHRDIARSAQAIYENAFFNLLGALHRRYGADAVVLAGGCAYNSVANGKVLERSPFKKLYVQSAGGDAGGAIGAAFATWHKLGGADARRHFVMDHAYWGPSATPDQIAARDRRAPRRLRRGGLHHRAHRRRGDAVQAHRRGDLARQGDRLVPGPHGMGPARARQPLDPGRSAPRRHEGHPQPQDQAPRILPAVRAVGPARGGAGVVRDRRRRAVHDAGLPDPRGQARRRSRRSPMSTAPAGCRPSPGRAIRAMPG